MKIKSILLIILSVLCAGYSFGQKSNRKIVLTGIVADVNHRPVSGAIIFVDNKKTGVTTDEKGFFRIKVKSSAKSISAFTMMNGLSEAMIERKTTVNISMKAATAINASGLPNDPNDEAINVGYGTMKKRDLTMQVGKIDGTNPKYASYKDIYDMIRGELPGVQVNGKSILIQGPSSINLSTEPLFVVDGMVVGSIDGISPMNVKSIEVLKGAAASIYGSRGSNGVIMINLRTGTEKR